MTVMAAQPTVVFWSTANGARSAKYTSLAALRDALDTFVRGRSVTSDDAAWVLAIVKARHPEQAHLLDGVTGVALVVSEFGTPGIALEYDGGRNDGRPAVRLKLGRLCGQETPRARFCAALRHILAPAHRLVREQFFEHERVRTCPVSALPMTLACSDVDHKPPWTFRNIVDAFLTEFGYKLDCSNIPEAWYKPHPDLDLSVIADPDRAERLRELHDARAQLRVVHSVANRIMLPAWQRAAESFED